jgi:hypothetical protein
MSSISSLSDDGSDYDGSHDGNTPHILFVITQHPTAPEENNSIITTTDKDINTTQHQSAIVQPPKPISTDIHSTLLSNWPSATTNPETIISYLESAWQQTPQHNNTHVLLPPPHETLSNRKGHILRARERQKKRRKLRYNSTLPLHYVQSESESQSESIPTSELET